MRPLVCVILSLELLFLALLVALGFVEQGHTSIYWTAWIASAVPAFIFIAILRDELSEAGGRL